MLTEVLYPSFHPSCSPEWLGKCPSRGASGIGPGENASRDGVLRLFRSRARKSIGKRFSQLLGDLFVFRYFIFTYFHLEFAIAYDDAYASGISKTWLSQQDEIVFPGKVWQQLKRQRKQNIHNAARLRRKWFPINLMGLSASGCNCLQKKLSRRRVSAGFPADSRKSPATCFQQLGLWLSWTWIVVVYCTSISACNFTYSSRSPSSSWHDETWWNHDEAHACSSSNSLFRGFTARTMILPDWSDLCGHLWCSALQNSWPNKVQSGGSGSSLKSSRFPGFPRWILSSCDVAGALFWTCHLRRKAT